MPNTVPAAATGLPEDTARVLNRRSALARFGLGIAATTAAASAGAIAAAAEPAVSPELERLIAAHESAYEAEGAAVSAVSAAEQRCWDTWKPLGLSKADADPRRFEQRRQEIENLDCAGIPGLTIERMTGLLSEDEQPRLKRLIRSVKRDRLKALEAAFATASRIREDSGIEEAEQAARAAAGVSDDALGALCSFRCATIGDVRRLAGYLHGYADRTGDFEGVEKALRGFAGVSPADGEG